MVVKITDQPSQLLFNHNAASGVSSFQVPDIKWAFGAAFLIKVDFNPTIAVANYPTEGQRLKFGLRETFPSYAAPITWVAVADFDQLTLAGGGTEVDEAMHVLKAFPLLGEQGADLVIDNDSGDPFLTGEARISVHVTLTI